MSRVALDTNILAYLAGISRVSAEMPRSPPCVI